MAFWTCELHETTRVFDSANATREYAIQQLTIDGVPPVHLTGPDDVHILYNETAVARCQPLKLQFAGNPNGHVVIITEGDQTQ